jgi:chemotaxis response regulator CheB
MTAQPGRIYIAPGDHHMLIERREGKVEILLNREPPETPAVRRSIPSSDRWPRSTGRARWAWC